MRQIVNELCMFVDNLNEMEWPRPMFTEGKKMPILGATMLKRYINEESER